jgi:hypothetical protein
MSLADRVDLSSYIQRVIETPVATHKWLWERRDLPLIGTPDNRKRCLMALVLTNHLWSIGCRWPVVVVEKDAIIVRRKGTVYRFAKPLWLIRFDAMLEERYGRNVYLSGKEVFLVLEDSLRACDFQLHNNGVVSCD